MTTHEFYLEDNIYSTSRLSRGFRSQSFLGKIEEAEREEMEFSDSTQESCGERVFVKNGPQAPKSKFTPLPTKPSQQSSGRIGALIQKMMKSGKVAATVIGTCAAFALRTLKNSQSTQGKATSTTILLGLVLLTYKNFKNSKSSKGTKLGALIVSLLLLSMNLRFGFLKMVF